MYKSYRDVAGNVYKNIKSYLNLYEIKRTITGLGNPAFQNMVAMVTPSAHLFPLYHAVWYFTKASRSLSLFHFYHERCIFSLLIIWKKVFLLCWLSLLVDRTCPYSEGFFSRFSAFLSPQKPTLQNPIRSGIYVTPVSLVGALKA